MIADRPIGVFDSGIGGLTVVRALRETLPKERVVYLGDTARLPYGTKSRKTIRAYTQQNLRFFERIGVKALVIACNTASALALPPSDSAPILGVIDPGAREAVQRSASGVIGVVGTRATIGSRAYTRAIRALKPEAAVHARACPLFVPLVEEGLLDGPLVRPILERYLRPLSRRGVDTLVLGCTHYPLLSPAIRECMGPSVEVIDSATAVANDLSQRLRAAGLIRKRGRPTLEVYLTDRNPQFARVATRCLGRKIGPVHLVDLAPAGQQTRV